MVNEIDRAHDALHFLDAGCDRDTWHKIGRAAIAAGVTVDTLDAWSSSAGNYTGTRDVQAAFRTIKADGGTGAGTLFLMARDAGWSYSNEPQQGPMQASKKAAEPPRQPAPGMSPADVWNRCEGATNAHSYITQKRAAGVPLDGLRVVPACDALRVGGESIAGALVVPVIRPDGSISSLQFIAPPNVAARLKAKGKPGKLNLPGCPVQGSFTVSKLLPGGVVHICEGIGQAWACWQATGDAAVVCFGWGRVRAVAAELRQHDASARLVLVPDVGKESDAQKIALEVGALVVNMPDGWPQNSDVNDLAQRDGGVTLVEARELGLGLLDPEQHLVDPQDDGRTASAVDLDSRQHRSYSGAPRIGGQRTRNCVERSQKRGRTPRASGHGHAASGSQRSGSNPGSYQFGF